MLIGQNKNNAIINGRFDFWQRGTSLSAGAGERRLADRFITNSLGTTIAPSRQSFTVGQTVVPSDPVYFHRKIVASSAGVGNYGTFEHRIESVRTFAGKKAVLSFWAKADATKSFSLEVQQNFGAGGSPSSTVLTYIGKYQMTSTWARFDIVIDVPSVVGKTLGTTHDGFLGVVLWMDAGTNFNARTGALGHQSGTFDFANVQMVEGEEAGDFELAGKDLAGELQLCQRYYVKSVSPSTQPGTSGVTSNASAVSFTATVATEAFGVLRFPVQMRNTPTVIPFDNAGNASRVHAWNIGDHGNGVTMQYGNPNGIGGFSSSGLTVGRVYGFNYTADAEL